MYIDKNVTYIDVIWSSYNVLFIAVILQVYVYLVKIGLKCIWRDASNYGPNEICPVLSVLLKKNCIDAVYTVKNKA